jgi:hypothetical protein
MKTMQTIKTTAKASFCATAPCVIALRSSSLENEGIEYATYGFGNKGLEIAQVVLHSSMQLAGKNYGPGVKCMWRGKEIDPHAMAEKIAKEIAAQKQM